MSYPALPVTGPKDMRELARVVNGLLQGRLNAVIEVPIAAGATAAVVEDPRLTSDRPVFSTIGSSITSYTHTAEGVVQFTVGSGPARVEHVLCLG